MKKIEKISHNGHMSRTWSFLRASLFLATVRHMVRETKFFLDQCPLSPPPFSRVVFTISLVNICFYASTYREVDPRCAEESSTLTCPYVSNVIPSWKFSFVRGSKRDLPSMFFTRVKDFWILCSTRRLRFYSETIQTDHKICFKSQSKGLFVNISGSKVFHSMTK